MNPVLHELLTTQTTTTPDGRVQQIHSAISASDVKFITEALTELKPKTSLEVGLAFGVSALAMCADRPEGTAARHIIIDPFQNSYWGGIGLHNLRRAGYEGMIEFHDQPSYRVLAQLGAKGERIDFAFIDGMHTFDYVLVDFFMIDKILNIGGAVVFDDADWPSIRPVIRYVVSNLPYSVHKVLPPAARESTTKRKIFEACLTAPKLLLGGISTIPGMRKPMTRAFGGEILGIDKKLGLLGSCIMLRKNADDTRSFDHHVDF